MIKFDCYNSRTENLVFVTNLRESTMYKCYGPIQLAREVRTKKLVVVETESSERLRKAYSNPKFNWDRFINKAPGKSFMSDKVLPTDKYNLCYFCSPEKLVSFLNTCPVVKHFKAGDHELVNSDLYRILVL